MGVAERPAQYNFSKNEIRYVFQMQNLDRPNLILQVKLLYAAMSATAFTELLPFVLKPGSDGKVYLPLQSYLNSLLDYVLPAAGAAGVNADAQCCRFFVVYREIDDDHTNEPWISKEVANERIAIKGGIEKYKHSRNNIFINYLQPLKKYLTWQPSGRFAFYDEPLYLSFINYSKADFTLVVMIQHTDNTTFTFSTPFAAGSFLYHVNVSALFLDLRNKTAKQIWYYEVTIKHGVDIIVNPYRLYVEYRPSYQVYDLVYHNSLGGLDTVRVNGSVEKQYEKETETATGGPKNDEWTSHVRSAESFYSSIVLHKQYKGNIGLLRTRTKEQQEALTELFVTKSIYMLYNSKWIPLKHQLKSVNLGSRKNTTEGYPVEWELSETQQVWTPDIPFGNGSDTETYDPEDTGGGETCDPVSIGELVMPPAIVGIPYNYSVAITGTGPFVLSGIVKPSWMTIAVDGYNVTFTGTPTIAGMDQPVQFTLDNPCGTDAASSTLDVNAFICAFFEDYTIESEDASNLNITVNLKGTAGVAFVIKVTYYYNITGSIVIDGDYIGGTGTTYNRTFDENGECTMDVNIFGGVNPGDTAIVTIKLDSSDGCINASYNTQTYVKSIE